MTEAAPVSRRAFLRAATAGAGLVLAGGARAQAGAVTTSVERASDGSPFDLRFDNGAIVSLKRAQDRFETDYLAPGKRLGEAFLRFRPPGGAWVTADTAAPDAAPITAPNAAQTATYRFGTAAGDALVLATRFTVKGASLVWTLTVRNVGAIPLEIGDLALPLPMNTSFGGGKPATASVFKHSFLSGDGSFLFWMRSNSVGPYLTMTPLAGSPLEYWDAHGGRYRVYLHSAAAGAEASAHGGRWRQPHTSRTLAPQEEATYGVRFDWAADYAGVRDLLVRNGSVDVRVVPGMTVPSDLTARLALRTTQPITAVEAEFPRTTKITPLGVKGNAHLYDVRFGRLGENRLMVRYGDGRRLFLEFFSTEPLETLVRKRGAFIAAHQERDQAKWYDGLLCEWNMDSQVRLSPDNYDRITGWRIYEVTCDDPGLSKPAFLATKNAEFPVQREVAALDAYVARFVWGGLQRSTAETYSYGVYGIPDWKTNRDSPDPGSKGKLHIWRAYDYPHVIVLYFGLYRIAKHHPQIKTALAAPEYLRRAAGTALALFTIPKEVADWSAYETGFYNERVIVDLMDALESEGMGGPAHALRAHWEKKVRFFVEDQPDLFGSEYPFDSTGFESTHALAKYAFQRSVPGVKTVDARRFLETQMAANLFCRGTIEPAYYYLGSDYRAEGGNSYTLTYMSQMGGWAVLDYGLHFAADPAEYLRLGYASYLSAWALMNTGTPESGYGFWYPGAANDGGAGGGFEPAAYGTTWLGQPHHRGAWYYASEIDLGYCGALRTAATILADDPLFGRLCYGGTWRAASDRLEVFPRDGPRRRFHARLGAGRLDLISDTDRFQADMALSLAADLSGIRFALESDNPAAHTATVRVSGLPSATYAVRCGDHHLADLKLTEGHDTVLALPMAAGARQKPFSISRTNMVSRKKDTS